MSPQPGVIAALLREREGYVTRGLPERAAHVDAQLAKAGYRSPEVATATPPPPPSKPEPETASLEAKETATIPRGRPRRSEPND